MSLVLRGMRLRTSTFAGKPVVKTRFCACRPVRSRCVTVVDKTKWELVLDKSWCDTHSKECAELEASLDLSQVIGSKISAFVGETDDCDFGVSCDKTGVKVLFESVGAANPLDSPAELYITDVGGKTHVSVDGNKLNHNQKVQVRPGSKIGLGDFAMFQVQRNVEAHA
ncbi:hypothetical protein BSKO_07951 [Bryopsis sp. KO-2023]|nr:hypothetical protein BSKO_07951 [Bryopsis sp. KO-2023]